MNRPITLIRCVVNGLGALVVTFPPWGAVVGESRDPATNQRPNVLLILADDVGCEVLESYSGQSCRAPHLNELAQSGLSFRHCSSMPVCHPTRVCLLTGRSPFRLNHP